MHAARFVIPSLCSSVPRGGGAGKNWAVTQGAEVAKGDYLLFADSDVTLYPGAVDDFVASMTKANVGWVSFLPKTTFSCFAE